MTQTAAGTLWCAYAAVGPVDPSVRRALSADLELVGDDEVAVVVGPVPEEEFGEGALEAHLNDRAWLERAASNHETVMRRLVAATTVVPLRFGSLHRDRVAVAEFLAEHRVEFGAALERVRGHVEVGVKVWVASPPPGAGRLPTSGRAYLEQRLRAREDAARARARLEERLRAIHTRLLAVSAAGVLNRPQPRELTGDRREMVMNAAYLVSAGDDAVPAEVERLRREHEDVVIEVTGPWAPYNFVEERDE